MNDDFNTPILIAHLFEAVKLINHVNDKSATISSEDIVTLKTTLHTFIFDILGLIDNNTSDSGTEKLNAAIELLIKLRKEARINKDFKLSDQIRDELADAGIELKDGREGTTYSLN
jgi:cysteinyl-tRNA synthetase